MDRNPTHPLLLVLTLCLAAGCSQLNDEIALPGAGALAGSWEYVAANAHSATFSNCSGDATVLEGATVVDGMGLAPLCRVRGTFEVIRVADAFEVVPFQVACSDGGTAAVSGGGAFTGTTIEGAWQTLSSSGVAAVQAFSGVVSGTDQLVVQEGYWSFAGSFTGSCELAPPLTATVEIR